MRLRPLPYLAAVFTLGVVYFAAAKLGLSMAFVAEQVTPVWPPTGIAFAAILLLGYRVWPGIALGAFFANVTANEPVGTACGIAAGNTLEAIVAAWLLNRLVGFDLSLSRLKDVLGLAVYAASIATMVSATIGVTSLCLGGVHPWESFGKLWWVWWLGDATGALLLTPVILTWVRLPMDISRPRVAEAAALGLALGVVGMTVFAAQVPTVTIDHPLEYAIFPFIIWAAMRFGQRGTATVTLVVAALAIWGTLNGSGPFSRNTLHENLTLLQMFLAAVAVTALLLSAALAERNIADGRRAIDLAVTHILAQADNLEKATPRILREICEVQNWDVGAIWNVDHESLVLRCVQTWHKPGRRVNSFLTATRERTFSPGVGLPGRIWVSGEPAWIPDVGADANFPRAPAAAKDGLRGAFGFPILLGGEVVGVVEFFSREVRSPDQPLLQLFAGIGSQLGQFIDRIHSEERLRESERNLRLIAENSSDVVFAYGLDRKLLYVNPAFEAMTGYTIEELRKRHFIDYLHSDDAQRMTGLLDRAFQGEAFDGEEFRIVTRTGEVKWCLSSWGPLLDADGVRIGVQGRERDITARKRVEQELREADRRKDEFLAVLAHELRNPLAPITNALHIMKIPGASEAIVGAARDTAQRQVAHLAHLVDDLLDVSRIMLGKVQLRPERVLLQSVVARGVETVQPVIAALGHQLTVHLPAESVWLNADLLRLGQIVANLLHNAAKYTEPGGTIALEATVAGPGEAFVEIRVRDNGIGIPAHMLERVFEPFVQAEDSVVRSQGGLGVGLTLVRTLVTLHGGTVQASSAGAGLGSEFVVRLPIAAAAGAEIAAKPPPSIRRPSGDGREARRVLVVDDNRDAAESLGTLLRLHGHDVQIAHDGPGALAAAGEHQPEVVFLDIGMPGMNGYEVARRLRADFANGFLLVALTGWGQDADRARSREAGFDYHLVKPVDPETVHRLLATGRVSGVKPE
jgi:PAS domain S-box-containing protein